MSTGRSHAGTWNPKAAKKLGQRWSQRLRIVLRRDEPAAKRPAAGAPDLELYRPDWAELYAFPKVFEYLRGCQDRMATEIRHYQAGRPSDGRSVRSARVDDGAMDALGACAVVVDQRQLAALPAMSMEQTAHLVDEIRLPLDPLWLDFTSAPGRDCRDMFRVPVVGEEGEGGRSRQARRMRS